MIFFATDFITMQLYECTFTSHRFSVSIETIITVTIKPSLAIIAYFIGAITVVSSNGALINVCNRTCILCNDMQNAPPPTPHTPIRAVFPFWGVK